MAESPTNNNDTDDDVNNDENDRFEAYDNAAYGNGDDNADEDDDCVWD